MNDGHNEGAGYVSLSEFYNVFEQWMTKLDYEIMPFNGEFHRPSVIHHFEDMKHEIIKRAKRTLAELVKHRPELAAQIDASTRIASSGKTISQQVADARDHVARATAPSLQEQMEKRRNLGKEMAKAEALKG